MLSLSLRCSARTDPPPSGSPARRPVRRAAALLAGLLAAAAFAAGPGAGPATAAPATVPLEAVTGFGGNPGNLAMYVYRPSSLPAHPAVIVALHGCHQSAQLYADNSGLPQLADTSGALLVFAETTSANNASSCFNWFQPGDNQRGQGEAASIQEMALHAQSAYGADPARTFVTGLSAGGAMTAVMLADYPDLFSAGAVIAGIPYDCTQDNGPFVCMNPGVSHTPEVWAQRVRDAFPSWRGPWPRVAVWQGDKDPTVAPANADALRDQWTAVHGIAQTPTTTRTIGPDATRQERYAAPDGSTAVEVDRVPDIGHGTPVDPGSGAQQCGNTGTANFIASICSSYWIGQFFHLDDAPPPAGLPAPTGLTVTGVTDSSVSLSWSAVQGAADYAVYRDGTRITTLAALSVTDTGLAPGSRHTYTVAARDASGQEGARSAAVTVSTTGATAACWTADNYHQVQAGRATVSGGNTYAKGSGQSMGLYNTFVTHTLKESPAGYFALSDTHCP
ncbi:esterase [Streptomyces sp. SDr-06]|uniref:extracellular catalytic domain type 1 short-chain-length polyhydroxyalkanoate depolymerase n=1 Tax=Streptomyces sp. SDr-06 TaxID=2267702 RepID=UPI000DE8F50B|nr:PHB depolymerase family esterase [Streptomyces sp. SDr-06]RCH68963.1 esterase [Streptomyces sp. SDr-06]